MKQSTSPTAARDPNDRIGRQRAVNRRRTRLSTDGKKIVKVQKEHGPSLSLKIDCFLSAYNPFLSLTTLAIWRTITPIAPNSSRMPANKTISVSQFIFDNLAVNVNVP